MRVPRLFTSRMLLTLFKKLAPRSELEQVSILPNWSPVVDAATNAPRPTIENVVNTSGEQCRDQRLSSQRQVVG